VNPELALPDPLRLAIEVAATGAFALSGIFEGARKRLDAVGVCVVGVLAAFGGGTLRDLLLDQRPFFWVRHVEMLWGVLLLCALVMSVMRRRHFAPTERAMLWPDALGLGLFTATGVQVGLQAGMPALVAVLLGVVTGVLPVTSAMAVALTAVVAAGAAASGALGAAAGVDVCVSPPEQASRRAKSMRTPKLARAISPRGRAVHTSAVRSWSSASGACALAGRSAGGYRTVNVVLAEVRRRLNVTSAV
jgi:hypothetical protein